MGLDVIKIVSRYRLIFFITIITLAALYLIISTIRLPSISSRTDCPLGLALCTHLQEQPNLTSSTHLQEQPNLPSSTLQEQPNLASSTLLRASTQDAFKEISDRNRERKAKIEQYCDYLKKTDQLDKVRLNLRTVRNEFVISRDYKLIWRIVPKCGYTTWMSHFRGLGRRDRNVCQSCTHDAILDAWQRLQDDDYVSFVFVRHPFTRLISAYRNKLNDSTHNWELGSKNNTRETSKWSNLSKNIAWKYGNGDGQRLCTFKEFVTHIVEGNGTNRHWNPISQIMFPCDLKYTVVGKTETFEEDTEYILKLKNITHINSSKQLNKNNPTSIDQYFSTLSKKLMHGLYLKYQVDIEMFGYNIDAFTKYM